MLSMVIASAMTSPHANLTYRPLEGRPEPTALTVRDLLQRVRAGKVRVPEFQRPLRWGRRQNLELLDSIWRGYPIGSLLLWKRHAPAGRIKVGTAELEVPELSDALWVVDGQQRLTALAASLLEVKQTVGEKRWELYFDVQEQEFVEEPGPTRIPLSVLGDLRRLGQYLRTVPWEDQEAWITSAEVAQQRILDYSIPAYIVDADNEQALRAIFARLNSTGSRMRTEEVFHALFGNRGPKEGLDLERLQEACNRDGFGIPSRAEVLKMVLAMSGEDPTRRIEHLSEQRLANLVSANEAEDVIARVIDFVREEAEIPHARLIPYPVVLSILSRWFHQFPETSEWNRRRLAFWLWRGAATAVHHRAELSGMRAQLRVIENDESDSLTRLIDQIGNYEPSPWRLSKFNGQSAHSRIETLALLSLGPLSMPEGNVLALRPHVIDSRVLATQNRVAREIFASRDWSGLDEAGVALARSGANRILLEEGHTGLQNQLRRLDPTNDVAILDSHLIDAEAFASLKQRDVIGFLQRRGRALEVAVKQFLEIKSGPDEPVRLAPLSDYLERSSDK
jgi:hypothetical protein